MSSGSSSDSDGDGDSIEAEELDPLLDNIAGMFDEWTRHSDRPFIETGLDHRRVYISLAHVQYREPVQFIVAYDRKFLAGRSNAFDLVVVVLLLIANRFVNTRGEFVERLEDVGFAPYLDVVNRWLDTSPDYTDWEIRRVHKCNEVRAYAFVHLRIFGGNAGANQDEIAHRMDVIVAEAAAIIGVQGAHR